MERALRESGKDKVHDILGSGSPRASGFIVTIYGDVAAPRGGTLWMGTPIESCAMQGISEKPADIDLVEIHGYGFPRH